MDVLPKYTLPDFTKSKLSLYKKFKVLQILLICGLIFVVGVIVNIISSGSAVDVLKLLFAWAPFLLQAFGLNVLMSILAMVIGTTLGSILGFSQISLLPPIQKSSFLLTQFFRNAPWLVTMFYVMYLVPFQVTILGIAIPIPDWIKATIGLSLPAMANVSEIVRGAVMSIPSQQWEAAESLGFSHRQIFWKIILPQCIKRMVPPWMNLYAIVAMGTSLASIVGVQELLTVTQQVYQSNMGPTMMLPMYAFVLSLFFVYLYPISLLSTYLETRTN